MDLSPAPGVAPAAARIRNHGLTEATLLLRNGEQLLLALVIPLGVLIGGRFAAGRFGFAEFSLLAPSVLTLAVWSSAFTSLAIATGFERRYGVLERLASTPLGRWGFMAGKALSLLLVTSGQLLVLSVVALLLGWRPATNPLAGLIAVVTVIEAVVAFAAWALLLAGTLRAEITLALANLTFLAFLAIGAVLVPVASYPDAVAPLVALLPTAALGEALRAWSMGVVYPLPLLILAAWAVVGGLAARKAFKWTS